MKPTQPDCTCQPKAVLVNRATGEAFRPNCRSWKCPSCAARKAKILSARSIEHFSREKFVTLWTLTITNRFFTRASAGDEPGSEQRAHHDVLLGAWRRMIQKIRAGRCRFILGSRFTYLMVKEQHKSGFCHLHVVVNQYAHWSKLQSLWESCVYAEMTHRGITFDKQGAKICNANITKGGGGKVSGRVIARYICKYLMKQRTAGNRRGVVAWRRSWSSARNAIRLHCRAFGPSKYEHVRVNEWVSGERSLILVNHRRNVSGKLWPNGPVGPDFWGT